MGRRAGLGRCGGDALDQGVSVGDVVNMKEFKKRKARAAKETRARRNRLRFGRSGPEKARSRSERERRSDDLEGKRLDRPED